MDTDVGSIFKRFDSMTEKPQTTAVNPLDLLDAPNLLEIGLEEDTDDDEPVRPDPVRPEPVQNVSPRKSVRKEPTRNAPPQKVTTPRKDVGVKRNVPKIHFVEDRNALVMPGAPAAAVPVEPLVADTTTEQRNPTRPSPKSVTKSPHLHVEENVVEKKSISLANCRKNICEIGGKMYSVAFPKVCYTCNTPLKIYEVPLVEWLRNGGDVEGFYNFYSVPLEFHEELRQYIQSSAMVEPYEVAFVQYIQHNPQLLQEFFVSYNEGKDDLRRYGNPKFLEYVAGVEQRVGRKLSNQELFQTVLKAGQPDRLIWDRPTPDNRYNGTLMNAVLNWIVGHPEVRSAIQLFINWLDITNRLDMIFNTLNVPQEREHPHFRPTLRIILMYGKYSIGFLAFNNLEPVLKMCCRINMRLQPVAF